MKNTLNKLITLLLFIIMYHSANAQDKDGEKLPVSGSTDDFLFLAYVLLMSGATVVAGLRIQETD